MRGTGIGGESYCQTKWLSFEVTFEGVKWWWDSDSSRYIIVPDLWSSRGESTTPNTSRNWPEWERANSLHGSRIRSLYAYSIVERYFLTVTYSILAYVNKNRIRSWQDELKIISHGCCYQCHLPAIIKLKVCDSMLRLNLIKFRDAIFHCDICDGPKKSKLYLLTYLLT